MFGGVEIGFRVTFLNVGVGLATGVAFTENLPGGPGIDWSIESQSGGFSITGSAPDQVLAFAPTTLDANTSAWVHIVSDTTAGSCGTYTNSASVTTGNDGSDSDSDETQVRCADIDVLKEADAESVSAGEQIGFRVTISNTGEGTATGLAFTDNLPGGLGISWMIESQSGTDFSITGTAPTQVLVYSPTTLAGNSSAWVHIVSATTGDSCAIYENTASVTTGNDGSDSDTDSTEVLCADIDVEKTADDDTVFAGEQIGFTVTITNDGDGDATGVSFTDNLPGGPGISWMIQNQSGTGFSITGTAPNQTLVFSPSTVDANSSAWVHIVSATTTASCATYNNTASVSTDNDGSDEASDSTTVGCPDLDIEKTAAESGYDEVGDVINYLITVTNVGDITLLDVIVTDLQVDDLDCTPDTPVPSLAPGASFTCTASHTITQQDLDLGFFINEACTDDGNGDGNVGALPVCDDVPVFGSEVGGETDAPSSLPPTDTLDRGNGSSPAPDAAWLLLIALGGFLGAMVVLTPARRRRS